MYFALGYKVLFFFFNPVYYKNKQNIWEDKTFPCLKIIRGFLFSPESLYAKFSEKTKKNKLNIYPQCLSEYVDS